MAGNFILILCTVVAVAMAQQHQGGGHEEQGPHGAPGRARRQAPEYGPRAEWTQCAADDVPLSCRDCRTRRVCAPPAGLLLPCLNPLKPHCNNGTCSFFPSEECAST